MRNWLAEERNRSQKGHEEELRKVFPDEEEIDGFAKDAHEEGYFQDVVPSSSSTNLNRVEVLNRATSWIHEIKQEAGIQLKQDEQEGNLMEVEDWDDVHGRKLPLHL
eukprot:660527-Karenia_brevis.AAC.1